MNEVVDTKTPKWLWLAVIIWLPASMVILYLFNQQYQSDFIQEENESAFYDELSVSLMLRPWLSKQSIDQQTAIHFYRGDCACNTQVKKHLIELKKTQGVVLKSINLDEVRLPFNLPATPALLLVDKTNSPKFFGAYGFGQFCQPTGNSIWAKLIQQSGEPTFFLNTIGKGCFCNETSELNNA